MRGRRKTTAIRTIGGNVVRFHSLPCIAVRKLRGWVDQRILDRHRFGSVVRIEDDLCFGIFFGVFQASENCAAWTSSSGDFIET
jgi:hypothetical protein